MPPKKVDSAAPKAKPTHASYQDMITDAIVNLKDRNGSSRQSLKKYVKANNNLTTVTGNMFDSLFNKALKTGVEKGVFAQPKGPSGGTKLAKKKVEPKKPAAKKETVKKPAAKKAAPKKSTAAAAKDEKKAPAPKAAAPKKTPVTTSTKKTPATKTDSALTKTNTGRVAKTTKPTAKKAAAPRKAAAAKA